MIKGREERLRLKEMFEQGITIDPMQKAQSVNIIKKAAADKIIFHRIKKADVIKNQLRFLDLKLLVVQLIGILCIMVLFVLIQKNGGHEAQYMAAGSCFAALLGLFVPLACSREYTNKLAELADSCYFNVTQSCALKMAVYGGMDLLLLLFLLLFASETVQKSVFELGIYFLVPFLVSCCMYFGILMAGSQRANSYLLTGSCVVFCMAAASLSGFPAVYEKTAFIIWLLTLPSAILLLSGEIIYFMHQIKEGEILCMN